MGVLVPAASSEKNNCKNLTHASAETYVNYTHREQTTNYHCALKAVELFITFRQIQNSDCIFKDCHTRTHLNNLKTV